MLLANSHFRAIVFGLVSLGMIVPAWATQPCKCGKKDGCCVAHAAIKHDAAESSCCAKKPCCAATIGHDRVETTCVADSVGCPCCTKAAPPINSVSQQPSVVTDDHQPFAIVTDLPALIPPVIAIDYLMRDLGRPPNHSALRLHALYRVWLI